jgi:hypothetical protein
MDFEHPADVMRLGASKDSGHGALQPTIDLVRAVK